jgi:hypothetical protein
MATAAERQRLSRKRRKRAHAGAPQAEADAAAKILGNQSLSDATYLLVHLLEIAMARARSAQGQEGHAVLGGHRRRENPLQDNELGRCGRDHSQSRLVWNPEGISLLCYFARNGILLERFPWVRHQQRCRTFRWIVSVVPDLPGAFHGPNRRLRPVANPDFA